MAAKAQVHGPLSTERVEAELGEIERGGLQRQGHVDRGVALVDREAHIDAGRNAHAEAGDAANRLAAIADEVADRAGSGRNAVGFSPSAKARRVGILRSAAAARIAAHAPC